MKLNKRAKEPRNTGPINSLRKCGIFPFRAYATAEPQEGNINAVKEGRETFLGLTRTMAAKRLALDKVAIKAPRAESNRKRGLGGPRTPPSPSGQQGPKKAQGRRA